MTGLVGGRAVVRGTSPAGAADAPARSAAKHDSARPHIAPWHGPIVVVVYRFRISALR